MPRARKHIVCLADTLYYHITSRCVRRAFLCGVDKLTGRSYEHRRSWVEDRVRILSSLFSVDLCAYAIMSNHYHLVVKLNPDEPATWSDDEVLKRWTALYRGTLLVQRYRDGDALTEVEQDALRSTTAIYRQRLGSLSWFMKSLNEPIARKANAEDHCTGHFWEARFESQPLYSKRALLAVMAYVDLNPVRAQIATTPEESAYTSIKARLEGGYRRTTLNKSVARALKRGELNHFDTTIRDLMPFADEPAPFVAKRASPGLPMQEKAYLRLIDATGRLLARGKKGRIDPAVAPILTRLGLTETQWTEASSAFRQHYRKGDLRLKQTA
jgi:REP element-mobilizing transposase RayT